MLSNSNLPKNWLRPNRNLPDAGTNVTQTENSLKKARKMENVSLKTGQKCAKNAKVTLLT